MVMWTIMSPSINDFPCIYSNTIMTTQSIMIVHSPSSIFYYNDSKNCHDTYQPSLFLFLLPFPLNCFFSLPFHFNLEKIKLSECTMICILVNTIHSIYHTKMAWKSYQSHIGHLVVDLLPWFVDYLDVY